MAKLYRSVSTITEMITPAFAVTAAIEIPRRPKDADPRRVGSDPVSFTICL